jgi:hypothetical protein
LTEAAAAEEAVKNGDQIANSTRRCAPTRQNRPLFEVSIGLLGLISMATTSAMGTNSWSSPIRFIESILLNKLIPVMLPPAD